MYGLYCFDKKIKYPEYFSSFDKSLKLLLSLGYDAALYSAATTYYQQQQASKVTGNWQAKKQGQQGKAKPKIPPKQPQLHYCDVCKISCAGPQVGAKSRNVMSVLGMGGCSA